MFARQPNGPPRARLLSAAVLGALLTTTTLAGTTGGDDFRREDKNRAAKDALEGQAPPPLEVTGWMNTPDGGLSLESLRGKVVVLDFWGTW